MSTFLDKWLTKTKNTKKLNPEPSSNSNTPPTNELPIDTPHIKKRACIENEASNDDIIGDPGMRKPINSYPLEIRDSLRRRYLVKGPCQPIGHDFPYTTFGKKKRRFQSNWFEKYCWLEYSVAKDKAYCLFCYLFANSSRSGGNAFTDIGYDNWKHAIQNFIDHEGGNGSSHTYCRVKVEQYRNQRENVDYVLSSKSVALEDEYRIRLKTVVRVTRHLLGEGLAFRGHDESLGSFHRGHFLGLIDWECEEHEYIRKVMQSNAPKNNQLTSPTIQRDLIESCAIEVRSVILNEIGNKYFSLLIDEARDSSVKEQMSIILRFVNNKGEVVERFLGLVHVTETSAKCLKKAIDDFFAKNGLSISKLRGQGYDGASNMRGELHGLKTLIQLENKHAHYIHCFAHQLQLVVVSATKEKDVIGQFFETLSMIVNTVGASCKRKDVVRQLHHDEVVKRIEMGKVSTGRGQNQEISLARPGDTRWGSHYKTLIRLFDMWNSVGEVLLSLYTDGETTKIRYTAGGLVDKMYTFDFVFIGKFIVHILGMTNTLSKILQAKDQNISFAIHMIDVVKKNLQAYRRDGWDKLLQEVTGFCEGQKIEVPNMEDIVPGRGRQLLDGKPKKNIHHFHVEIFLKVIDLVALEFDNHFTESNTELLKCLMCLDPSNSFANYDHEQLLHLAGLYSEDFSSAEISELDHELELYICEMKSNREFFTLHDIGALAKKLVEMKYHTYFPLVYRLIELALVLPVGTATVERSFSAMNIVKTDLRNRIGDDLLSDCLLCFFEKEIFVKIDNEIIMQRFQNLGSRRNFLRPTSNSFLDASTSVSKK